jgi:hypothetical protein
MKKAVITAVFSNKNKPIDLPIVKDKLPGWDYICFTNCKKLEKISIGWEIKKIETDNCTPIMMSKIIKWNAHKYIDHDIMIWVDGYLSPRINRDWNKPLKDYLERNFQGFYMIKHPNRKCIFNELNEVVYQKKETQDRMNKLNKFLKKENMVTNYGMYHCNIFIRFLKNEKLNKILENMTNIMRKFTNRDQTIFTYILWKNNYQNIKLLNEISTCKWWIRSGKKIRKHKY